MFDSTTLIHESQMDPKVRCWNPRLAQGCESQRAS